MEETKKWKIARGKRGGAKTIVAQRPRVSKAECSSLLFRFVYQCSKCSEYRYLQLTYSFCLSRNEFLTDCHNEAKAFRLWPSEKAAYQTNESSRSRTDKVRACRISYNRNDSRSDNSVYSL